jgi:PmbA protein
MTTILASLPDGVQGELYTQTIRTSEVKFSSSQLDSISRSELCRTTMRVIKDSRISVAVSSKPDSREVLLENALEAVQFGTPVQFDFPGKATLPVIPQGDECSNWMETETILALAEGMNHAICAYDSRIAVEAVIRRTETEVSLINSNGMSGQYQKTVWEANLGGQLVQGDDFLWVKTALTANRRDLDYEKLKKDVIQQFDWSKEIVQFAPGSYPVIFAPGQVDFLTAPLLACLNGKAIVSGISPWKDKLGEKLLDSRVTLMDDGTLPQAISSKPFDRDGIPTRRNILIEQGIVKQFLLDCQSARELGMDSTGNSTAGGPAAHHVLLAPGELSIYELIQKMDTGLLILDSMGAWSGNLYSGNVSGNISLGLKIENGKIVGRVKNCMFSMNAFRHFRDHLIALSRETKDIGGSGPLDSSASTYPYVALADVVITAE